MSAKSVAKTEALPDLDDLLQCPVCYEIPSGQIFQCNEGHHVCGRCKARLDVCPVCRSLFFGTRNYAMEELIASVRKLRAFKLGGKVTTTGTSSSEDNTTAVDDPAAEPEEDEAEIEEENLNFASRPSVSAPQACKGLFRCLCCKNGNAERLPAARLLNHLRYFHAPELIEGKSDDGEYLQAWQFATTPGRIVTAVRISDMGIFFLVIELSDDVVCAWLTMAASPWVAHEFCYTVTISGNDREAIFSDCVWSVRSCEGSLKKRGHCLVVNGLDAHALVAPAAICGKLSVKRVPADQVTQQTQPRAVLRIASRGNNNRDNARNPMAQDLEPFLQDLQNDVARLSRAFATLGREANALVRSEAEMRARIENGTRNNQGIASANRVVGPPRAVSPPVPPPVAPAVPPSTNGADNQPLSRNARRRMRQRVRVALNANPPTVHADWVEPPAQPPQRGPQPGSVRAQGATSSTPVQHHTEFSGLAIVQQAPTNASQAAPAPSSGEPSNGQPQNGNQSRSNKKKRRHRR